ncbi:MAG: PIN domain-containing protein [Chitinispirillaceae bacterium]|nr:PIN domain-containing protein [Chitinispirillaceae bacterium]
MSILVDSSVWIDYFRGTGRADTLDLLIEENLVVVNDLILAELLPPLLVRKNDKVAALLRRITRQTMNIQWDEIITFQTLCLKNGINGVGIPDLIIAQNTLQGQLKLMTNNKHFHQLSQPIGLELL